ncbi:MAG: hypothetical protein NDJ89_09190 [Oligoflexia bacterium]|nr:hypothetical protein [Oligoflexia bacterium]
MKNTVASLFSVLFAGVFVLVVEAGADTQTRVVTVTTDAFPGVSTLDVVRGEMDEFKGMIYRGNDGAVVELSLAQLRAKPQVIKRIDDHDVIYLGVEKDFEETRGGHANMRFLASGISGDYRNFRILLETQGQSLVLRSDPNFKDPESDRNSFTSVFNRLFLRKATFWGRTIGIEEVRPSLQMYYCFPEFLCMQEW